MVAGLRVTRHLRHQAIAYQPDSAIRARVAVHDNPNVHPINRLDSITRANDWHRHNPCGGFGATQAREKKMPHSNRRDRVLLALTAAACLGPLTPAFAQSTAAPPAGDTTQTAQSNTQPAASATSSAQKRAANKAARKSNRAQKDAELQKLEKNGYNPSGEQHDYPDNIQNAEKKANGQ
jgi:hypothetical protein